MGVVPVISAIKKGSETMSNLERILPTLECSEITEAGIESYRIQKGDSGMYVKYKFQGMPIHVNYEQGRNKEEMNGCKNIMG
jgi:hypothetical protein